MGKLQELLDELCPNGVRYIALGEVTHYSTERVDATNIDKYTYIGVDNLLPEKKGKTVSDYVPTEGRLVQFEAGDILIGNIRPYLKKIWLADTDGGTNGDVLVIRIEDKRILAPAFLYYVLSADSFFDFNMQNAKGAKMPRGDKAAIMRYEIPIPPLPVQAEIVRILDAFTELTVELVDKLNLEIIARKKQYTYYRDLLLSFDNVNKSGNYHNTPPPGNFWKLNGCRLLKSPTVFLLDKISGNFWSATILYMALPESLVERIKRHIMVEKYSWRVLEQMPDMYKLLTAFMMFQTILL